MFFHRVPLPADDANTDELYDCFGRQRHNKHRDDMSGVGSFMKPCRTLFVGGLVKHKYSTPKALEDAVWKHFAEWGELENVNVIHRLSIAFPRYRLRTSAGGTMHMLNFRLDLCVVCYNWCLLIITSMLLVLVFLLCTDKVLLWCRVCQRSHG